MDHPIATPFTLNRLAQSIEQKVYDVPIDWVDDNGCLDIHPQYPAQIDLLALESLISSNSITVIQPTFIGDEPIVAVLGCKEGEFVMARLYLIPKSL